VPADSLITKTIAERAPRDDLRLHPALLVAGNADSGAPALGEAALTFESCLTVGRRAADLVAGDAAWEVPDHLVSRAHCRIDRVGKDDGHGPGFVLTDLGSRNGTFVDGQRVNGQPVPLNEGAIVSLGSAVAVFRRLTGRQLEAIRAERKRPLGPVATGSPALALVCQKLRKLAPAGSEILLLGETGVGKEIYARAIHALSGRSGGFVAVNCAALPRELVESELFGFARGAHSEARFDKRGLVEDAEGGTLFLDEIGDMPPALQAKLLRFLQDKELLALGSNRRRRIDVRVLAATNRAVLSARGPGAELDGAGLRLDLASRLGAEPITLPPLRQRIEDLGRLCALLLGPRWKRFDPEAFLALALHRWPGNVRELGMVLENALALAADDETISTRHLPEAVAHPRVPVRPGAGKAKPRPAPDADELATLLRRFSGNVARVARELDRKAPLIYRWCHRHQLNPDSFRASKD
jgi:transcriptional regulator with PAS, ATPase and Fis domain